MEETHRNRVSVIKKAADMVGASYAEVEEAFEYQFKFIANHIKTKQTKPILLKRLGKFTLNGRYKGPESFDIVDESKMKK